MYTLLTVLIVISAVLLTLIVLAQNPKGGGLNAGFSASNQIMGVRRTTEFLEKATWGLTAFIVVASIVACGLNINDKKINVNSNSISQQAKEQAQKAVAPKQQAPAAQPSFPGAFPKK
jgi:preprotein translocase subunit SecG